MAKTEPAIFTNMCMVYDDSGNVLVQNRRDPVWGGIAFPGGHVEYRESFVDSVIREVKEETGLDIRNPVLCGVKQWPEESTGDARYVVLFFRTNEFSGELSSSPEGEVFWVNRADIHNFPLAQDFEDMLRLFESEDLSEFYYYEENNDWKYRVV